MQVSFKPVDEQWPARNLTCNFESLEDRAEILVRLVTGGMTKL